MTSEPSQQLVLARTAGNPEADNRKVSRDSWNTMEDNNGRERKSKKQGFKALVATALIEVNANQLGSIRS